MSVCTTVMYHYVRPLRGSNIKGLDTDLFDGQLDYLQRHYNFVRMEELVAALDGGPALPPASVLLTFDDGIIDHYTHVFPRLKARNIAGAFFPPAAVVLERELLDVHRVHHILAECPDVDALATAVDRACQDHRVQHGLETVEVYRSRYGQANRFDPATVVYVKRMLQHALPESLRHMLAKQFFAQYVAANERSFAEQFYVSAEQLREMVGAGMHVGSHGDTHQWLSRLGSKAKGEDVAGSLRLLRAVGCDAGEYTICYPYGDYDDETLRLVADSGFKAGFTTQVGLSDVKAENRYRLARLDTNDLPKKADAALSDWTIRVQNGV